MDSNCPLIDERLGFSFCASSASFFYVINETKQWPECDLPRAAIRI